MTSESDTPRAALTPGQDLLESTLMAIAQGTAAETGDAFFRSLVKHLALTLGVRYAFVARFTADKTRLRTLALWAVDGFAENREYAMAGTPCEAVLEGEMRLYPQGVQALFPTDRALAQIGAESYLAVPLIDNAGEVLGHLAVIDTRPMRGAPAELAIFRIFAARTVAEMERLNAKRAMEQANRLLEQRVQARTEALLQAHERLRRQEQLAAIGGFAAGIVHEIRSPLSTVNMALDYLKGSALAEPAARRVALASGEAARLERLLSEILRYAKPPRLQCSMLAARGLLEDTLAIVRGSPEAADRRVVLQCVGEPALYGDRDKLQQVFINLLGNACEASPEGAAVTVEAARTEDDRAVRVRVHNTGEPIPPQALSRLTEPFYSTKAKGTGLGLAIVQRLVEAHGGRLGIESSAREGTRVSVTLPSSAAGIE